MLTLDRVLISYVIGGDRKEIVLTLEQPQKDFFYINEDDALSGKRIQLNFQSNELVLLDKVEIFYTLDYAVTRSIFANGFQSWSESKLYKKMDKIKPLRQIAKSIMKPYGDYTYFDYSGKEGMIHSWTYTYFHLPNKRILFFGSVDEKNAFTNFVHHVPSNSLCVMKDVKGWQVRGTHILADLFLSENSERGAFQHYFMLCGYEEPKAEPAIGWTSWYHYYTKISEKIVLENLENFKRNELPIKIFQIDDGYQTRVGDWLSINEKFPNGMKFLADEIKKNGFQAGIWLAPLVVERKSLIFQQHPDWIVKNSDGSFCKVGVNPLWSMAFYALDIYNEEVRDYIKKIFNTVCREWGYDIVKLDFLYGACLVSRNGRSRAGVMSDAMQLLREAVGNDKMILGCGVPLGVGMGTTDYCRIGADVHLTWDIKSLKWCNNRERASTLLAITNTINRRQLNGYAFINDPDVFILRRKKQFLSQKQQYSLLLANLIFGDLIFTSDNIADYDENTMNLYRSIFPLVKRKEVIVEHAEGLYKIFFQIEERRYLALINLSEKDKLFKLPTGIFFDAYTQDIISNEQTVLIKKRESLLMHCCSAGPFGVIGTKGHFFPGSEIAKIALQGTDIKVRLRKGLLIDPIVYLKIPKDYTGTTINGNPFQLVSKKEFSIAYIQLNRNENI
ncbi:MAG: alpha-galactosidase [Chitinophagales bacterium]|nr:alpha-galactosidase [Chitinophagales bacterium]